MSRITSDLIRFRTSQKIAEISFAVLHDKDAEDFKQHDAVCSLAKDEIEKIGQYDEKRGFIGEKQVFFFIFEREMNS